MTTTPPTTPAAAPTTTPRVSVLLPVHNAMPWLPSCVASVLMQTNVHLELIAVDDNSSDNSLTFLRELEDAMREQQAECANCHTVSSEVEETNGEQEKDQWEAFFSMHSGGGDDTASQESRYKPPTPAEVAKLASRTSCVLRVACVDANVRRNPSGQGLALNTALQMSRGELIGEMEADDLRPPWTFHKLVSALDANPAWDGVTSKLQIFGWDRPGMQRYVDWQNSLVEPNDIARGRFVEIPAQRASGLYRRASVFDRALVRYRDIWEVPVGSGTLVDCAVGAEHVENVLPKLAGWWPVDTDFWMRYFEHNLVVGKLDDVMYMWRQYPEQSTRTHSRTHVDRIGDCKAHYLARLAGDSPLMIVGRGKTLSRFVADLKRHGGTLCASVDWKPGTSLPEELSGSWTPPCEHENEEREEPASKRRRRAAPMRVFVYGAEKARRRVASCVPSFDAGVDWFAA
ncbi:glycosyltransferase [Pseudoscourfieldia marina]